MTTQTEALRMALEALEESHPEAYRHTITAIKEALAQPDPYKQGYADAMNWKVQNHLEHLPAAQPEQEPVADSYSLADKVREALDRQSCPDAFMRIAWETVVKHYTTPPQRKEPEQEPAKYKFSIGCRACGHLESYDMEVNGLTTPPQRTWVGLTDEDMNQWIEEEHDVLRWAEAKLEEKNT